MLASRRALVSCGKQWLEAGPLASSWSISWLVAGVFARCGQQPVAGVLDSCGRGWLDTRALASCDRWLLGGALDSRIRCCLVVGVLLVARALASFHRRWLEAGLLASSWIASWLVAKTLARCARRIVAGVFTMCGRLLLLAGTLARSWRFA